jgi:hypothetical protein
MPSVKTSVLRLLDTWWTLGRNPAEHGSILQAFTRLVSGHALAEPEDPAKWEDARPGAVTTRMEVRVKDDAYSGEAGPLHNGRRGVVVAIRYGDVIVDYRDGRQPAMKGVHHSPNSLQRRIG